MFYKLHVCVCMFFYDFNFKNSAAILLSWHTHTRTVNIISDRVVSMGAFFKPIKDYLTSFVQ